MDKLVFYHQKRRDGGIRTGIDLNGEKISEKFEPGDQESDSSLAWFVDVRLSSEGLPADPEAARGLFLRLSENVREELRTLSEDLRAGIDNEWPVMRRLPALDGINGAIYCSAVRRLSSEEISEVLSRLENNWDSLLRSLPVQVTVHA